VRILTQRDPTSRRGALYDPARHPLLGFERGDDPVALDWQSCWLAEGGVRAVSLCCGKLDSELCCGLVP